MCSLIDMDFDGEIMEIIVQEQSNNKEIALLKYEESSIKALAQVYMDNLFIYKTITKQNLLASQAEEKN